MIATRETPGLLVTDLDMERLANQGQAKAILVIPEGFGTRLEALDGFQLLTESGAAGTQLYIRPDEVLEIGQARLDGVTYGFYQQRLYFVALFTSGRRDAQAALSALQAAYGPGTAIVGDVPEYVWQGQRVSLHFRQDPVTEMGMVGFTSRAIDMQMKHRSQGESLPANAATD